MVSFCVSERGSVKHLSTKEKRTIYRRIGFVALSFALLCGAVNGRDLMTAFASPKAASSAETTKEYTFKDDAELADFDMWYAPTLAPDGDFPAIGGATANWHLKNGKLLYKADSSLLMGDRAMLYADGDWVSDFKVYKYNTAADSTLTQKNQFNHPTLTAGPLEVKNGVTVQNKEGNTDSGRDLGYLDFVGNFWNKDVTHTLTHKQAVTEFLLEADIMIGKQPFENAGAKGIMIAPAGEFAFSSDGNAQNDKGVYITVGANLLPTVAGAIKPETATVTSGKVVTERKGPLALEPLKSADASLYGDAAIGTLPVNYKAVNPKDSTETAEAGKITLCIEIRDGKLSVWNKAAKDANVLTVDLSAQYAGGCVSYVATSVFSGSLCGMRLKDYRAGDAEKTWDYGYAVVRNEPIQSQTATPTPADASYGEVELPIGDLFKPGEGTVNTTGIVDVAVDAVRKEVLYKSADQTTSTHSNYGIAVLHARKYGDFTMDVDVRGNDRVMLGFGAQNTSDAVFPSQTGGGYAFMIGSGGSVRLVGSNKNGGFYGIGAVNMIADFTPRETHHYTVTVTGKTATVSVDNGAVWSYTLPTTTDGYIYLAANHAGDSFSNLKIGGDTYTFDTVQTLKDFTMWYMPVGRATAEVPAINLDRVVSNGNWYVDDHALCFMHDTYLYKTAAQLEEGVTLTVPTEAGVQTVAYKSADDETSVTGNFGIAMLNTRKYTNFRLEVSVIAGAQHSYIGFGAKGGSNGVHIGQENGGYAFHAQAYSTSENLGLGMLSAYDTQSGGRYDLLRSGNFTYDITKDHRYIIEVKNGVVQVTIDGISVVKGLLPMYEGGYIYLASNQEGGGFYNLKITAPDEEADPLPTDISNTVTYTFDKESDLDAFESWYVYGASDINNPAVPVTAADGANWYIDKQQTLSFKENKLYAAPDAETKEVKLTKTLTIDGVTKDYELSDTSGYPAYNSNFGIAMLKATYTNFILEADLKPTNRHIYVGFGAKGGHNGVFKTQTDGGFAVRLNKDGSNDAAKVFVGHHNGSWFAQDASTVIDVPYSEGSYIHLRLVVSDGVAYYYFNDAETPITANLGDAYTGGHIYFAVNYMTGGFDNIRITDLDKKQIVVSDLQHEIAAGTLEIDRSKDASLSDITDKPVDVVDQNGYGYCLPVKWASDTYRSYRAGTHEFRLGEGAGAWHNVTIHAPNSTAKLTVLNNLDGVDYDPDKSRKYYFDHDNDLLDFVSQYSQEKADGTMSGWSGDLLPDEGNSVWTTNGGVLSNTAPRDQGTWTAENKTTVHSLLLKDLHLYNFKIEMDYRHAKGNWWYTYLVFGVQDPSYSYCAVSGDSTVYTATKTGGSRSCGVWTWVEQEGRLHQAGNLFNANNYYTSQINYTEDVDGSAFIANYPSRRNETHHITIEVVNGEAWLQVDDSGRYYFIPAAESLGGYLGVATHRNGSTIDNLQITALDEDGRSIALADAPQGFAPDLSADEYTGWDADDDAFDWGTEYLD